HLSLGVGGGISQNGLGVSQSLLIVGLGGVDEVGVVLSGHLGIDLLQQAGEGGLVGGPLGVQGDVGSDSGVKVVGGGAVLVGVPAGEGVALHVGSLGLSHGLAIGHHHGLHSGAAHGVEGHLVAHGGSHAVGVEHHIVHLTHKGVGLRADAGHGDV